MHSSRSINIIPLHFYRKPTCDTWTRSFYPLSFFLVTSHHPHSPSYSSSTPIYHPFRKSIIAPKNLSSFPKIYHTPSLNIPQSRFSRRQSITTRKNLSSLLKIYHSSSKSINSLSVIISPQSSHSLSNSNLLIIGKNTQNLLYLTIPNKSNWSKIIIRRSLTRCPIPQKWIFCKFGA